MFTVFYSQIPEHMHHFQYLFGLEGHHNLVAPDVIFAVLSIAAFVMLILLGVRRNEVWLALACIAVFVSLWIEKGLGLVITGFIPSPLGAITEYHPTGPEITITLGVWAAGFFLLTVFTKFLSMCAAASMAPLRLRRLTK